MFAWPQPRSTAGGHPTQGAVHPITTSCLNPHDTPRLESAAPETTCSYRPAFSAAPRARLAAGSIVARGLTVLGISLVGRGITKTY